jgi:hypothetical protein
MYAASMDEGQVLPAARLQQEMIGFIRAFGLLSSDRTPCGQPMAPSDAHALTEIVSDGGLTQRELVDRLRLDRSSVSRLVDRLAVRGWVERANGPDRRTVRACAAHSGGPPGGRGDRRRQGEAVRSVARSGSGGPEG